MVVYRVQRAGGLGPYQRGPDLLTHPNRRRPSCMEDGFPARDGAPYFYVHPDELFGFQWLQQVTRWFTPAELTVLVQARYVLMVYEVDPLHVTLGRNQLVFDVRYATPVGHIQLTDPCWTVTVHLRPGLRTVFDADY